MARELLTYAQVADEWKFTVDALRKKVERGELPVIHIGRSVRFDRRALDRYLADQTEEAWA